MSLTVWTVIFTSSNDAFGYSRESMITYIFLIAFLQSIIISSSLNGLASRIYSGEISNHLLKPLNIFALFAVQEIADKFKNTFFLVLETLFLFLIFKPIILFPDYKIFLIFIAWAFGGLIMNFIISLLFGSLGFWSPQVWGPQFLFFMILEFTAGKLFPLDILPKILQKIIYLTPFPYLSFLQIQLFLERLSADEIIKHSIVMIFWIITLGLITKIIWKKGLRSFESVGR
ncbi:ABC-2 family transporter protein [Patescibacteria group bacterium]|nr:ABC-2 family transporter protein [Patescibacteria group bacterium]